MGTGTPHAAVAGARILVVEDDASVSYLVCEALRDLSCDPLPVEDGRAALAIIDTFMPHAIILDIMLPRLDGMGVVRALRNTCSRSGLPMPRICVMTAGWRAQDVAESLGIDVWLSKPFILQELQEAVEKVLLWPPPSTDEPSTDPPTEDLPAEDPPLAPAP